MLSRSAQLHLQPDLVVIELLEGDPPAAHREGADVGGVEAPAGGRETATALRISPKTVGHHVKQCYAKIGVATRACGAGRTGCGSRTAQWRRRRRAVTAAAYPTNPASAPKVAHITSVAASWLNRATTKATSGSTTAVASMHCTIRMRAAS